MKQALLAVALFLSWIGSVFAQTANHKTITLTEEGCQQVAMAVPSVAHKMPLERDKFSDDVNTVIDYILDNNVGLEGLDPIMLHRFLLESCLAAQGRTDIPVKTKA